MTPRDRPAIEGGRPIRERPLPYGRHLIVEADVEHVARVLRGDWLTTGPTVDRFEDALATTLCAQNAVAVSSGTAALHAACAALGLQPGDEVILPALTFVASANAVLYVGAVPVFAEVDPDTFLLDPVDVDRKITPRTRAIMVVHYAGLEADLSDLRAIADRHALRLVEDAAHALGAGAPNAPVGSKSDLATFSFHPVKHVTTGEGGAVVTRSTADADFVRRFRNHGLSSDARQRERANTWHTEMIELGFNYRLSDIGAALGLAQLARLREGLERRRAIAQRYRSALSDLDTLRPQRVLGAEEHAWHIYPVRVDTQRLRADRDQIIRALRAEGIGANLHYPPVHLHPYYRERFGYGDGHLPVTERICRELLTLPLFPSMTDTDASDVVAAVRRVLEHYRG